MKIYYFPSELVHFISPQAYLALLACNSLKIALIHIERNYRSLNPSSPKSIVKEHNLLSDHRKTKIHTTNNLDRIIVLQTAIAIELSQKSDSAKNIYKNDY